MFKAFPKHSLTKNPSILGQSVKFCLPGKNREGISMVNVPFFSLHSFRPTSTSCRQCRRDMASAFCCFLPRPCPPPCSSAPAVSAAYLGACLTHYFLLLLQPSVRSSPTFVLRRANCEGQAPLRPHLGCHGFRQSSSVGKGAGSARGVCGAGCGHERVLGH